MQRTWVLLPLLLLVTIPAMADGGPEQAAVAAAPGGLHARAQQQLRAHGTEVDRLQQQVSTQESHSLQAAQRLEEQDRQIAQLMEQLKAVDRARQGGAAGH